MSSVLPFRYQVYLAALKGNVNWLKDLLRGLSADGSRAAVEDFKDDARQVILAAHQP